jgi:hypothetical protein
MREKHFSAGAWLFNILEVKVLRRPLEYLENGPTLFHPSIP